MPHVSLSCWSPVLVTWHKLSLAPKPHPQTIPLPTPTVCCTQPSSPAPLSERMIQVLCPLPAPLQNAFQVFSGLNIYILYACVCVIYQTASVQQFGLSGSGTDCDLLQKSVWQWILRRERKQWQSDALRWLLILYRFQIGLFAFSPSTPIPAVCQKFIQSVIPPPHPPPPTHTCTF